MACLHYWGSPYQVATHHLARRFAADGWDVAYLSAPITPLHLFKLKDSTVKERFKLWFNPEEKITLGNGSITTIIPFSLFGPDNQFPLSSAFVAGRWPKFCLPTMKSLLLDSGFEECDVFYLDNFYHSHLTEFINAKSTVYHMADNYSAFPGYSEAFRKQETELVQNADIVFYPSREMEPYIENMKPQRTHFLPNGVDYDHFALVESKIPKEYKHIPMPRAVYVGAIDEWFDFELVEKSARANPGISIVLIGGDKLAKKYLPQLSNLYLLGRKMRDELPAYLQHAQAGIIPFDVEGYPDLLHPVRPLKMLEYFSAGIPCLSATWNELESMQSPAYLAQSEEDFIQALPRICAEPADVSELRHYAAQFKWDDIFEDFLGQLHS
jgi:hypothetical protein